MFSDIWEYALLKYKTQKLKEKQTELNRAKFKLNNHLMREKFKKKFSNLIQREVPLYQWILKRNSNNILNQEYYHACKNYYKYYILYDKNIFKYEKVGDKIYNISFTWSCFNCLKNINDGYKFCLKMKFYQKHDYPLPISDNIVKVILNKNIYINSFNKQYIYNQLINIWNKTK